MGMEVKITCPKCGGTRQDIILELRGGHNIPIGFRCLEEGCGWQGKDRLMVFTDNPDTSSASIERLKSKSIGQLKDEAIARGDYIDTKRGFKKSVPRSKTIKTKTQAPVLVAEIIVPMMKPLDHGLLSTTPVICSACEQPVVEIWVKLHGTIENLTGTKAYVMNPDGYTTICSVCGESIYIFDKFSTVEEVVPLLKLPLECTSCHVTPDKYSIAGNLVFSWTGKDWQCSGESRLICPGCSNVLSIYNVPKTC